MKKVFAIVALVAAMFVAGNVQAQTTIHASYAPETFSSNTGSETYQGFFVGLTQNFGLAKGFGVAAGAQFRMNMKSQTVLGTTTKATQTLIDIPVLFNYEIGINRDLSVTPFVGPMLTLALTGNTKVGSFDPINWYGEYGNRNRLNLNAVFGANVRFTQFNLFGGYRLGLLDQEKSDNFKMTTSGFFIGLGYSL